MRNLILVNFVILSLAIGFASPSSAEEEGIRININEITCRDMLKMDDDEHDFALVFLHGFMSGEKSMMLFDGPAFSHATDEIVDYCIDHPNETLLSAFEKFR